MPSRVRNCLDVLWAALLLSPLAAHALPLDDFDDGIDPNWFVVDTNFDFNSDGVPVAPKAWGPGVFDAPAGQLSITTTGPVPPNDALPHGPEIFDTLNSGLMALGWGPSTVDSTFSNGLIRAKVRVDNPSNVDLVLRTDPVSFSGYVMAALGSYGEFHFSRLDNGVIARDETIPGLAFTQGEDWMMEFGAVGNELSMKAWRANDTEPAQPQLALSDDTYSAGAVGVVSSISTNNISQPTAVAGIFDDVTFTPVEPSSGIRVISPSEFASREAPAVNTVNGPLRYHQIYPESDFHALDGNPHLITEIAFRPDRQRTAPSEWRIDDTEISLGYTSATSNNISSRFDSNFGSGKSLVYDGPLTLTTGNVVTDNGTKEFDQVVSLQAPFRYDPSEGNLLMEIIWRTPPSGALLNDGGGPAAVIALSANASVGNRIGGLPTQFTLEPLVSLRAGDSDQDLDFDQLDLVQVQIAGKYLTGQTATWGEGDWNGAPGGNIGHPPAGDGVFNQFDIIAATQAAIYLTGTYAVIQPNGETADGQTSVVYNPATGEVAVDTPAGVELTSINIDSASAIFTGQVAQHLGGSFDNDADTNIFKATFGGSFGSVSFGNVAQSGLSEDFILNDLSVVGSLAGGGDLGSVDLVYVPEPASIVLLVFGFAIACLRRHSVISPEFEGSTRT